MSEHEYITPANSSDKTDKRPPTVPSTSAEAQPLILYDLSTIVGSVYQQRITLTRQGTVTKRFAHLLRPLLHGSPRNEEKREDAYVNMLCEAAKQLQLIYQSSSLDEDEHKPYYCPSIESGLEKWSQINVHEQARQFLAWWKSSMQWHDVWSTDLLQWDRMDWNPLAARGLLVDLLSSRIYIPGRWYSISSLLDTIWLRGPYFLRPAHLKERSRTQSIPISEVKLVEQASRLTLTQKSVLRGIENGMSVDQMLTLLNASSKKAVPQNVTRTLKDWEKPTGKRKW